MLACRVFARPRLCLRNSLLGSKRRTGLNFWPHTYSFSRRITKRPGLSFYSYGTPRSKTKGLVIDFLPALASDRSKASPLRHPATLTGGILRAAYYTFVAFSRLNEQILSNTTVMTASC